tara:strand:- start:830 stop:1000 length:171 start_codon:yes stop_codon:yes gene_type:complete
MTYPDLLETILTHIETIDDEIGKRDTELIQTEVDALWELIHTAQTQEWIRSVQETT